METLTDNAEKRTALEEEMKKLMQRIEEIDKELIGKYIYIIMIK